MLWGGAYTGNGGGPSHPNKAAQRAVRARDPALAAPSPRRRRAGCEWALAACAGGMLGLAYYAAASVLFG